MASIKITAALLLFSVCAQAQTFGEWFNQKSTQKKYLLQQIAALNTFRSELKAGYNVAKHGLGSIGGFNTTEYDLHNSYYASLNCASPAVKNNSQVKDILSYQQDINTKLNTLPANDYYNAVKAAVLKDCGQQLDELQQVLSGMSISDADRLKRISAIYTDMLSNYHFVSRFCYQASLIEIDKTNQPKDLKTLKKLYASR
jgi:hypothetical protein